MGVKSFVVQSFKNGLADLEGFYCRMKAFGLSLLLSGGLEISEPSQVLMTGDISFSNARSLEPLRQSKGLRLRATLFYLIGVHIARVCGHTK